MRRVLLAALILALTPAAALGAASWSARDHHRHYYCTKLQIAGQVEYFPAHGKPYWVDNWQRFCSRRKPPWPPDHGARDRRHRHHRPCRVSWTGGPVKVVRCWL